MAQKTTERKIRLTASSKAKKAPPAIGDDLTSARQEYPEVKAAIERGLADVAAGRVHRMSFAEYADIPLED